MSNKSFHQDDENYEGNNEDIQTNINNKHVCNQIIDDIEEEFNSENVCHIHGSNQNNFFEDSDNEDL